MGAELIAMAARLDATETKLAMIAVKLALLELVTEGSTAGMKRLWRL